MSIADHLVDRRRLRSRLTVWRVATAAVVVLALLGLAFGVGTNRGLAVQPQVARVSIGGVITGDEATIQLLDRIAAADAVKALVLTIESPGGTTTGAERLYDAIRRVAAKKPVVATVNTLAASGGYIAALGADHIVAYGNSLVGSIGVLFEFPNVSGLLDKLGVKFESVKSAPLKAAPNGFEPTSDAARAALAGLVADSFDWFKGLVKSRRGLSDAEVAVVSDGRVFTGRQGVGFKLVDELGGQGEAITWLETQRGVGKGLTVRDWRPERGFGRIGILGVASDVARLVGMAGLAEGLRVLDVSKQASALDGLVSVWHPPLAE